MSELKQLPTLIERTYVYHEVQVGVRIDFKKRKISLIDGDGVIKKYTFANREVDYMQGWQRILTAIGQAIAAAEKELREYIAERDEEVANSAIKLAEAIAATE